MSAAGAVVSSSVSSAVAFASSPMSVALAVASSSASSAIAVVSSPLSVTGAVASCPASEAVAIAIWLLLSHPLHALTTRRQHMSPSTKIKK